MVTDDQIMPLANVGLTITEVDGELLVLDQSGGQIHQLNPSAGFIFGCCDGQSSKLVVRRRLIEEFDIDSQTAEQDLDLALKLLADQNLITDDRT